MVFRRRRFCRAYCFQPACLINLLVTPNSVRPHICTVEVGFRRIEDHSVDCSLVTIFVVLYVLFDVAGGVYGKDVSEACMVVEGVAVDVVGGLLAGEEEYRASLGVGVICSGCCGLLAGV